VTPAALRAEIIKDLAGFTNDPLGHVLWAYPWGVEGTSLAAETGPDAWQRDILALIRDRLQAGQTKIRIAVSSGKGIGKSALISWLTEWAEQTLEHTRGVVTANTETQLRTKTWAELAKWHGLLLAPLRDMFKLEGTSLHASDKSAQRTWRIDAIPNSEKNPEAFAGLHNKGRRIFVAFDEGSSISDAIYETTDGIMSDADTVVIWIVFGNPTRAAGRFRESIEGRLRALWHSRKIDNRTVKITDKEEQAALVAAYGEDSDYVRVNVRGEFPRAASTQFIARDLVEAAARREPGYIASDPVVLGVDVARFGDDASVITPRRGRDARSMPWTIMRGLDTMQVAAKVVEQATFLYADAVFIDESGVGAGVLDRVRQIGLRPGVMLAGVNFGGRGGVVRMISGDQIRVHDFSAAMWSLMRDWLALGSVPDDQELIADLTGREYGYDADMAIQLERKADMKKRGLASPDKADGLALTFAYPVAPRTVASLIAARAEAGPYDPHSDLAS
jgi:hypothetical protein